MAHHELDASVETVHWGYFDAALEPVIEVASGDTVTIRSVSGGRDVTPEEGYYIPPELYEIQEKSKRPMPGHMLTGPVLVTGAKAGQVLEVRIKDVSLRQDWGYNYVRPLAGGLPYDFDEFEMMHIRLDAERMVGTLPWGLELPLKPFFGVMGVAPPKGWGMISSIQPRAHGGNLDNKELVAGSTLYLPIFNDGALFSVGDGHGCQGDGEVCVTAIETALEGRFELILRDDMELEAPRAETSDHYITMGIDEDLDEAARQALRRMIDLIAGRTNLSKTQAYQLCSLAADLRVTQIVNGTKGIHVMLEKRLIEG
ncbi:MAG: acetamidase/formamidase family protein [Rhodospirillaceae bacterium]|jgi:acetamidase/formamidase|nr:acetamidase/formamidase family protein [Rhodospirillaceae bacterium]MBT6139191.1 acetamidase/formamidase family protein [Rhodospirillaceae bacterium]